MNAWQRSRAKRRKRSALTASLPKSKLSTLPVGNRRRLLPGVARDHNIARSGDTMAKPKAAAKTKKQSKPAPAKPAKAKAKKPAETASKSAKPAPKATKAVANKTASKPDGASKAAGVEKPILAVAEGAAKSRAKAAVSDSSTVAVAPVKAAVDDAGLAWMDATKGYQVALDGGKLVARNAAGKKLSSVPKEVRETDLFDQIESMRDWLVEHDKECIATVEQWMLRSLPVPRAVLQAVWEDPAWRKPLENAVVVALDAEGMHDFARAGLFRGVDPKKGVGIVDLDGETGWLDVELVAIPHPILIPDLDTWRELVTQLGVTQGIQQLHRETHAKRAGMTSGSVTDFRNGKFAMLLHALGKARSLGYKVRGGFASCKVLEGGVVCEARYWIGADSPDAETYTGDLSWVDHRERGLAIESVGPVAFSEGMRMASAIYAARVVEKAEES